MSNLTTETFWETLHDKYWQQYALDCELGGAKPRLKDFMIWAEEHNLVPEIEDNDD